MPREPLYDLAAEEGVVTLVPHNAVSTVLGIDDDDRLSEAVLEQTQTITLDLTSGKMLSFQAYLELAQLASRWREVHHDKRRVRILTNEPPRTMVNCAHQLRVDHLLDIVEHFPTPRRRRATQKEKT